MIMHSSALLIQTTLQRPDLDAPRWHIEGYDHGEQISPGYWFVAPYEEVIQASSGPPWNAPHIYDSNGELVWSGAPVFNGFSTFDFRAIDVLGEPMLSVIHPHEGAAFVFDKTYKLREKVYLGPEEISLNRQSCNIHEFMTVDNGTRALHLTRLSKKTTKDNSLAIDFDGNCYAGFDGFRELDVESWDPVFEWSSEDHIGLDESVMPHEDADEKCASDRPWEFLHANSLDKFPNGDYLLSGRRTYAIYRISHIDGSIIWRLGGRRSDFKMSFEFSGQHSARVQEQNATHTMISILDNAYGPGNPSTTHPMSRGLLIVLDTSAMTADIRAEYPHPGGKYATSRGNVQMLPNGNVWSCWTDRALQSEHAADGTLLLTAGFKPKMDSYRSWKLPWVGSPEDPPDVRAAAVAKNGITYTIVHMTWNGATEVNTWKVYHTDELGQERKLATETPKYGFETAVWTEGQASHVVVEAFDETGRNLGESYVFATIPRKDELISNGWLNVSHPKLTENDSTSQARVFATLRKPMIAFLCGVLACLAAGCVVYGIWYWAQRGSLTWWQQQQQQQQTYKPLSNPEEELLELQDHDGGFAAEETLNHVHTYSDKGDAVP
ncbi:hypothetical protein LTR37_004953 [Vermiconidia calcicola]|uniref:Uncharacterized protein n=1 Tax=Vermiconidia calcicola TaxID=1690605 RepID=A0ACC3NL55_9PEZI|nr:hypothetical protein LTR37_004953 [Vermiconidia calcicola]